MKTPVKTLKYQGYDIEIHYDDNPLDPRKDFDHAGTMVCTRGSGIGDSHDTSIVDLKLAMSQTTDIVYLPVYMYSHSGVTIRTTPFSDPWDSGQVGIIYMKREKVIEEFGDDSPESREKAKSLLESEVKEYDQFLTGDVYGYLIKKDGKNVESCWGFYGDDEYCLSEAKASVDYLVEAAIQQHLAKVKNWIRNKVPLVYRTALV